MSTDIPVRSIDASPVVLAVVNVLLHVSLRGGGAMAQMDRLAAAIRVRYVYLYAVAVVLVTSVTSTLEMLG